MKKFEKLNLRETDESVVFSYASISNNNPQKELGRLDNDRSSNISPLRPVEELINTQSSDEESIDMKQDLLNITEKVDDKEKQHQ